MKRITRNRLAFGIVMAIALGAGVVATALAASNPTPTPNSAILKERVFNDCPTSTLTSVNNYPALISFDDQNVDCFGFANLHVWRFSADGGATEAVFDNNASFRFSADFKIEGDGNGEGGIQIAPWWSHDADGLFNVRSTDGEIAVFGGRLPFYSFTGSHGLHYVKGDVIGLEMIYEPRALSPARPATVEYKVHYNGNDYTSGPLAFDMANPAEDPPHGLWGMLNDGRVGGHFKAFLGQGSPVNVKATFTDIEFGTTPIANSAVVTERVFNDCPTSTLVTTNNYPSLISFDDQNVDCFGFANLHIWRFSENGVDPAIFNNNARYRFSADFKIEGDGNGEGGLQIAPWWSKQADGLFNVRSTDGEIAVFGGRLPFYSFTGSHGLHYVKGDVIGLEMVYSPNGRSVGDPATVEYRVRYQGNEYSSGPLPFDQANPAEDPPYGAYGMLNDGQAGGHFKAFLGQGTPVTAKATFTNIRYSTCDDPVLAKMFVWPFVIHSRSRFPYVTVIVDPPSPYDAGDVDVSSLTLNGVPPAGGGKVWFWNQLLKVKFDRAALVATLPVNEWAPVLLAGKVGDDCFEATAYVKVKAPRFHKPAPNSVLVAGSQTEVQWETPEDVQVSEVTLLSTFDDGVTWTVEAQNLPNSGSYLWTVPNVATSRARLAVSLMVEQDETGPVNEVDVAESENFAISSPLAVGSGNVEFALHGPVPNPGRGLNVSFSLPTREPATLEVYDVTGRQIASREVGALGPGRHLVALAPAGRLPIGVYMVQLSQGARKLNARAVVIE